MIDPKDLFSAPPVRCNTMLKVSVVPADKGYYVTQTLTPAVLIGGCTSGLGSNQLCHSCGCSTMITCAGGPDACCTLQPFRLLPLPPPSPPPPRCQPDLV